MSTLRKLYRPEANFLPGQAQQTWPDVDPDNKYLYYFLTSCLIRYHKPFKFTLRPIRHQPKYILTKYISNENKEEASMYIHIFKKFNQTYFIEGNSVKDSDQIHMKHKILSIYLNKKQIRVLQNCKVIVLNILGLNLLIICQNEMLVNLKTTCLSFSQKNLKKYVKWILINQKKIQKIPSFKKSFVFINHHKTNYYKHLLFKFIIERY